MRWSFLILFCLCGLSSWAVPRKFQVCTMTINSSEEGEMFRRYLPEERFEFVELVPNSSYSISENHSDRWFTKACRREDVQCDMLIISGHFAGMFFGTDNQHVLSIYELEQMACQGECPNIFKNLKEVFLFGCNTMAHKGLIQRTPEEYLNVLLEYGLPKNMAETVVAGRFSVLDFTYKEKMEHIFSERTRIYGFTELSPLGRQASNVLKRYLSDIRKTYGSYYDYLVEHFYDTQERSFNSHFHDSFSMVSAVQQSYGMNSLHPRYDTFQKICRLYSNGESTNSKMKIVKNLFESEEGLVAFSAIKNFLVKQKSKFSLAEKFIFNEIKRMRGVQEKFISAYSSLDSSLVYIKSIFLHFLRTMGWFPKDDYRKELTLVLRPSIQNPSLQSFDILEALVKYDKLNPSDILLKFQDFNPSYLKSIWSVLLVDLLRIDHEGMQLRLMQYCLDSVERRDLVNCYQVFKTLGHLRATEKRVLEKMSNFLGSEDEGMVYYAMYGLAYSEVRSSRIHFKIIEKLYHPDFWIRLQAIQTLDYLGLFRQKRVRKFLMEMLSEESNQRVIEAARRVLAKVDRSSR